MNEINQKPEYWVLSLSGGKDSTGFPVGAVRCRALKNYGTCENIFPICGQSCWTWNTGLGEPSGLIIQLINWKSALLLKKNGLPLAFRSTEPVNL